MAFSGTFHELNEKSHHTVPFAIEITNAKSALISTSNKYWSKGNKEIGLIKIKTVGKHLILVLCNFEQSLLMCLSLPSCLVVLRH